MSQFSGLSEIIEQLEEAKIRVVIKKYETTHFLMGLIMAMNRLYVAINVNRILSYNVLF